MILEVNRELSQPNRPRARRRAPHEHSWQVPDGQYVVKLAVFHEF